MRNTISTIVVSAFVYARNKICSFRYSFIQLWRFICFTRIGLASSGNQMNYIKSIHRRIWIIRQQRHHHHIIISRVNSSSSCVFVFNSKMVCCLMFTLKSCISWYIVHNFISKNENLGHLKVLFVILSKIIGFRVGE